MTGKGIGILTNGQTNKNDTENTMNTPPLYNVYEIVFYSPEELL